LDLGTVAVVRPRTEEARVEAAAFQEEFQALGGSVPREILFDSGGTFFQPQFQEVETILPDGLFLPLTPRDVQLLAPQVTFYGLDTLGIQLLGTWGWTEEAVVQGVDSRHTDGVVASTVRLSQDETEAFRRFREGYESLFQKTLRSQVPAFGYDCAALIFAALEARPRNPEELVSAIEGVRDLPAATGNLSVDRGWVTREPLLVRIQDHELIYITRRYD
jgi:ABC-type branched-subunit amino acid transport system substrate-binding protein